MKSTRVSFLMIVVLALMPACGGHGHSQDRTDQAQPDIGDERPTVAVTHWTDRTELFMEYPVFVAGASGRAAVHVTDLADFSPLSTGQAVVHLRSEDGRELAFQGGPSRPGIFGIDLEVSRPGVYEMTLRVDAPELQDLHELGQITVHPPEETLATGDTEEGEAIAFLKEQQWTLEFGTATVELRSLRPSITVPAIVAPRSGGDALLTAPVPGRVNPAAEVPVPGTLVRAGDVLVRIAPRSDALRDAAGLRAELVEAEQEQLLASGERDRAERLVAASALPARRLDEAEAALTAAQARLDAARDRWGRFEGLSQSGGSVSRDGAIAILAPFDGVVSEIRFAPGASVEENQVLLRVVDPDRLHVVGAVPESRARTLESVDAGELLRAEGTAVALGKPLAIGRVVEPSARTTEVRFALDNRPPLLYIGQSVGLRLFVGDEEARPAIPESAVVDDGGRPVVFVQNGGESFERRPVRLGSRADGFVHVLEGVAPGERVVHRGAYLVRLAALSTQIPAHGHVH